MSGHNRWTKIKHQKMAMGNTKGKLFTKVIKEITVAAKMGGGDPAANARLRSAIEAGRAANMPNESITRAVKKGTGELEGVNYEELTYEGYGPHGVALMVRCLTDNKNRTAGDIRSIFTKGGGNMGSDGSVSWMFDRRGVITVKKGPSEDELMEAALDAGALDVSPSEDGDGAFEVKTEPADLHKVYTALEAKKVPLAESKVQFIPKERVHVGGDAAMKVLKLMEMIDDNDDVQDIFSNADIDDSDLEAMA